MSPPDGARIPTRLNLVLVAAATSGCVALLWCASHARTGWELAAAAVSFSFLGNTVFSLLHEAVHGVLHPSARTNAWLGRWLAAFFPTGFGFQRAAHLGHHRRNRSEVERFDWIGPDDSAVLKVIQWYGLLTGFFWVLSPLGCLAYLVAPRLLEAAANRFADQTSANAMVGGLLAAERTTLRLEIAASMALQATLFVVLGGTVAGWAACYAAFALNWSALQYADHAWSPLDVREGAWNLHVNPVVQAIFLNYHLHLVHHRSPTLPWIHLPAHIDPKDPAPSFLSIYLRMWAGPRRLPDS
ncbi:MAG: fatty acid desaturase [Myxococcales bacterium]|nr:fatty acid desaturase [Myxococcales bacterium]